MREVGNIQVLRGLAAMSVVALHAQQELTWRHLPLLLPDMFAGAAGVDVFFVISGFIMLYASHRLFGQRSQIASFFWRRIARIAPLYWMISIVTAIYTWRYHLLPYDLHSIERWLVTSLFFRTGAWGLPILPTGWTLNYEMFFYLVFGLSLFLKRKVALPILITTLPVYGVLGSLELLPVGFSALANSVLFDFVGGLLIAMARLSDHRLPRWTVASMISGGIVTIIAVSMFDHQAWLNWRGIAWGIPATVIVAGGALAGDVRDDVIHRVLKRLGDASFSIYIVHYFLFSVISRFILPFLPYGRISAMGYFVFLMSSAILIGWVVHRMIEVPLYRQMTGRQIHPKATEADPSLVVTA